MSHPFKKRASGRLRKNLEAQLARLESTEFIRRVLEEEPSFIFKHVLTQETARESLLLKTRRKLHRQVAQSIEQIYADRLDENAALLAQHYHQAGDDAKTLEYAIRAGDLAARVYANDEALQQYALALGAAQRTKATTEQLIHLYTQRGRVLEVTGKFAHALEGYEEMATLARARTDRPLDLASLMLRATARATPVATFDAELAQRLLDQALILARELADRAAEARILWILTLLNIHTSHLAQAVTYGEEALAIARELNDHGQDMREQLAFILHDLSTPLIFSGQRVRGEAMQAEARALWRELGNKPLLVDNLGSAAQVAVISGDFARALEYSAEGVAIAESIGNLFGISLGLATQVTIYAELGEFDRALRLGAEALRLEELRRGVNPVMIPVMQAWLLGSLGAFEQTAELERRARQVIDGPMPGHFRARAHADLARLNILRGEIAAAQADLAAAYRDYDRGTLSSAAPAVAFAEAELALAQGDAARVIVLTDQGLAMMRQVGARIYLPDVLYLRGQAFAQQGKVDEALEALREARTSAESINARRILWQILAAMSDLEMQRGDAASAETWRAAACAVIQFIAEHTPDDVRDSFLRLPQVRAVLQQKEGTASSQ